MKSHHIVLLVPIAAIVHLILHHVMAEDQVVASLFAAGGDPTNVAVAIAFVGLRVALYLAGPGVMVYGLLLWARRRNEPAPLAGE